MAAPKLFPSLGVNKHCWYISYHLYFLGYNEEVHSNSSKSNRNHSELHGNDNAREDIAYFSRDKCSLQKSSLCSSFLGMECCRCSEAELVPPKGIYN